MVYVLDGAGIPSVPLHQGVDTTLFHPGPPRRPFGDRFVVFSGGKLAFRKGQDLVVAAFRRFHRRHPDALLVTCWQNSWPDLAGLIVAGRAAHAPEPRSDHGIDVEGWMARMGLAEGSYMDVDFVSNERMPAILR